MAAETTPVDSLSARRRWTILTICALALFVVGLDTTIVTVGLPEIGHGLGVEADRLAWVIDAYTVMLASLLLTSGALADRFGRRRVFQIGLFVFGAASLACALAPSLTVLVVARAMQGVGASMLTPVALAIVVNTMTDPTERARAIGVWSAVFGISMAAGPMTGGILIAAFDWRALFWINIPVVLAAMILVVVFVPESRSLNPRRLDLPGQLLLVLLLGTTIALLIEGPRLGWTSTILFVGVGAVGLLTAAFIWVESKRAHPLLEPALFRVRSFSGAVLGAMTVFIAFSMTLLMTTLLLQNVYGWSPLSTGAAILPMAVGATLCAPVSGYLVGWKGPRLSLLLAGASIFIGGFLLLAVSLTGSVPLLLIAYLIMGIGVGFANAPITNTAVSELPPERAGVAGGATSTARQFGTAIGIALAGGLAAGSDPGGFASASLAGWITIAACGAVLMLSAVNSPRGGRIHPHSERLLSQ